MNGFLDANIGWMRHFGGADGRRRSGHFLFPKTLLRLAFKIDAPDGGMLFFVMHWGVLIFVVGALLKVVAFEPALRTPVLIAAAIEKFAILFLVLFGPLKRTPGMTFIAAADGSLAVIYTLYLIVVGH